MVFDKLVGLLVRNDAAGVRSLGGRIGVTKLSRHHALHGVANH